ncbi:hypothetical protein JHK82_018415 [Glycine max]|nr:hypothetical protein JHK86_018442 [Glycine max]KAG5142720.1 hypothetical protein JHK82_018415 [Glycine max]
MYKLIKRRSISGYAWGIEKVEVDCNSQQVVVTRYAHKNKILKAMRKSGLKADFLYAQNDLLNAYVSANGHTEGDKERECSTQKLNALVNIFPNHEPDPYKISFDILLLLGLALIGHALVYLRSCRFRIRYKCFVVRLVHVKDMVHCLVLMPHSNGFKGHIFDSSRSDRNILRIRAHSINKVKWFSKRICDQCNKDD